MTRACPLLTLAFTALGQQRFFHQLYSLGHPFEIAGVEAEVLVHPLLRQSNRTTDLVSQLSKQLGVS